MLRLLTLCVMLTVAGAGGLTCISCYRANDTEEACNTQKGTPGTVTCNENQVCTTNLYCRRTSGRYWVKGCKDLDRVEALDKLLCTSARACRYHCNSSWCNAYTPQVDQAVVCESEAQTKQDVASSGITSTNTTKTITTTSTTTTIDTGGTSTTCTTTSTAVTTTTTTTTCPVPSNPACPETTPAPPTTPAATLETTTTSPTTPASTLPTTTTSPATPALTPATTTQSSTSTDNTASTTATPTGNTTTTTMTTGSPTTTPTPIQCHVCEELESKISAEDADTVCNEQGLVTCASGEMCWTRLRCRKQGEPGRYLITKECKRHCPQIFFPHVWSGANKNGNYAACECCYEDGCNANSAPRLDVVLKTYTEFCGK